MIKWLFFYLGLVSLVPAKLLIDFNAPRGDQPSIGQINLEEERNVTIKEQTADLFFKKGADWQGNPAAHVHRKAGYIRAEYHGLKGQIEAGKIYYIGYTFAIQEVQQSLMLWQWKEYSANGNGGANIPLALEVINGNLVFQHQDCGSCGRNEQWRMKMSSHVQYIIGIEIYADSKAGTARLWVNGKPVTMTADSGKGTQVVKGNMYPGDPSPKWGAYRGEEVEINTWIYDVQVSTTKSDMNNKYFT